MKLRLLAVLLALSVAGNLLLALVHSRRPLVAKDVTLGGLFSVTNLSNWTVERSCSLFQFKDFSVAAAGGADFGCEEFLEGNAFG
jgi:hypothetical protein